jgi:hypothetical protein
MQTTGQFDIVIQMPESTQAKPNAGTPAQPMQENEPVQEDPVRGEGGGKNGQAMAAAAAHIALNAGKQAAMAAISNIGLATGNSALQQRVQSAVSTITKGVGYTTAIASGNWAMAVGMLASDAIGFVSEMYQEDKNRQIANYSAEQYARKLGYTNGRK